MGVKMGQGQEPVYDGGGEGGATALGRKTNSRQSATHKYLRCRQDATRSKVNDATRGVLLSKCATQTRRADGASGRTFFETRP